MSEKSNHGNSPETVAELLSVEEMDLIQEKLHDTSDTLSELDEKLLLSLFEKEFQRAGVSKETLDSQYVPLSEVDIIANYKTTWTGQYSNGLIALDGVALCNASNYMARMLLPESATLTKFKGIEKKLIARQSFFTLPSEIRYFRLLKLLKDDIKEAREAVLTMHVSEVIIHEELHALTDEGSSSVITIGKEGYISGSKVGMQENYSQSRLDFVSERFEDERYRGINEAITQLYALHLNREFLKQSMPGNLNSSNIDTYHELYEYHAYTREQWIAEQMIIIISTIAEVPEDIVKDAFFSAYLNNETILPEETLTLLTNTLDKTSHEDIETSLLKLQVCLGAESFDAESDIHEVITSFLNTLPEEKQKVAKDKFAELFIKYSVSKELNDAVTN